MRQWLRALLSNLSFGLVLAGLLMAFVEAAHANPQIMVLQRRQAQMTVNSANWTSCSSGTAWTITYVPYAGALVGKAFEFNNTASANGWVANCWTAAGTSFTDGEVLARMNATNPGGGNANGPEVHMRVTGLGGGSANSYWLTVILSSLVPYARLSKSVSGIATAIATSSAITFTTEPAGWSVTATDSSVASGQIAVVGYNMNYSPIYTDYFSYATGTATAPGP